MSRLRTQFPLVVAGVLALLVPLGVAPASAEAPVEVVDGANDGVFIAAGRDFDLEALQAVVDEAEAAGVSMIIAAPADPQPNAEAFALRIRQQAEVDVTVVFGIEGETRGSVSEDYFDGFARAEKAAAAAATPTQAASDFFDELMQEPPGGLPDIVKVVARWVMALAVLVALASAAEMAIRNRRSSEQVETGAPA